jgi:hypothetical protein
MNVTSQSEPLALYCEEQLCTFVGPVMRCILGSCTLLSVMDSSARAMFNSMKMEEL